MNNNRQENLTRAAASHRQSLRQSLQRRLEAARARGDQNLISQLEAEAHYLGL